MVGLHEVRTSFKRRVTVLDYIILPPLANKQRLQCLECSSWQHLMAAVKASSSHKQET
jgi:hypothetical protein